MSKEKDILEIVLYVSDEKNIYWDEVSGLLNDYSIDEVYSMLPLDDILVVISNRPSFINLINCKYNVLITDKLEDIDNTSKNLNVYVVQEISDLEKVVDFLVVGNNIC